MTLEINRGTAQNDGTGDTLYVAAGKINANFAELDITSKASKTTPVDTDCIGLMDSAASNLLKKLSWANLKAGLWDTVGSWTKAQRVTVVSLSSSSASIAIDLSLSNNFSHTLTENTTLANPSNIVAGQSGQITITQHASAAKTLAVGSYWKSADGATPTVSTTVGAVNLISYYVNSTTHITFSIIKHGVA